LKVVNLESWEAFETEAAAIFRKLEKRRTKTEMYVSPLLFRGHTQESWKLETTLERYTKTEFSITGYYRLLLTVAPTVESLTAKSWNLPHDLEIDESYYGPPPGYDFMIYLRHHGFPSPLLDWSRSPYVAAFFAFRPHLDGEDGSVAIYSYIENYGYGKEGEVSAATIIGLGPCVSTHKRHFIQQSQYTICRKRTDNRYVYCNHEDAFQKNESRQDILTKYLIPKSERTKVLEKLDFMNINSYSLFGDEDNLMATLAYREIERRHL
jgi:hypothetical protein